jgi:hypothetical protein
VRNKKGDVVSFHTILYQYVISGVVRVKYPAS